MNDEPLCRYPYKEQSAVFICDFRSIYFVLYKDGRKRHYMSGRAKSFSASMLNVFSSLFLHKRNAVISYLVSISCQVVISYKFHIFCHSVISFISIPLYTFVFHYITPTREFLKAYLTEKQNGYLQSGRLREVVAFEKWFLGVS